MSGLKAIRERIAKEKLDYDALDLYNFGYVRTGVWFFKNHRCF